MKKSALIAISIGNGNMLVSHVWHDGDGALHRLLEQHYPTRELAANLINLGSLFLVGNTIDKCILMSPKSHEEAKISVSGNLEKERRVDEKHAHLFIHGQWFHWTNEFAEQD